MHFALFLVLVATCSIVQQLQAQPVKLTPVNGTESGACRSTPNNIRKDEINVAIRDRVNPSLNDRYGPPCNCGGAEWTKVADLDMSSTSQVCPPNWLLHEVPDISIRGCGSSQPVSCTPAIFPSRGTTYSQVCGRVIAFQRGTPDAFGATIRYNPGLEGTYIDGISLTHGAPGSRQHIWSFVGSVTEVNPNLDDACSCSNVNVDWPYTVPSFVGGNYFCDSADRGPVFEFDYYPEDPLWNAEGCGPTSTCCRFNNPPWFCTKLPSSTSDDLEARICGDQSLEDEDIIVTRIELYVK